MSSAGGKPPGDARAAVTVLRGIGGSPGVVVGRALVVGDLHEASARRLVDPSEIPAELGRVRDAVEGARRALGEASTRLPEGSPEAGPILEAYGLMLGDPTLHERVTARIEGARRCAEWAVVEATEELLGLFDASALAAADAYLAERRHDIEFVRDALLRALGGGGPRALVSLSETTIVIARDLSPADTANMVREPIIGFVTASGSRTSHSAIMARALEIPAVVGATAALSVIRTGDLVIVDGFTGEVTVHPGSEAVEAAEARARGHLELARRLLATRDDPCRLASGERVVLRANVELPAEAILAQDHGAEGIGLYRTEFLYVDRSTLPSEEEQYQVFRAVSETMQGKPTVLRTFDIGGDKFVTSFRLPAEMNPALGLRAVRLALERPEMLLEQLRAMVRASAHGDVRVLVPMVTSVREVRAVRKLLEQAIAEVRATGAVVPDGLPFGIMIEVPSAAIMADRLAAEVDFFSIGTNDLVQYALAIDRSSDSLAHYATPFDPAIVRLVAQVVDAARRGGVPVGVCGAVASEPLGAALLVGLGVRELSMEAAAIPEIKAALGRIALDEAESVARTALSADTAEDVERAVREAFAPRLADFLHGPTHPQAGPHAGPHTGHGHAGQGHGQPHGPGRVSTRPPRALS